METALILAIVNGAFGAFEAGMKILAARRQNAEMTKEEEEQYDAMVEARLQSPEWQPSKPETPPAG